MRRGEGEHGDGREHCDERHAEHVGGKGEERGSMEIDSHGEGHTAFGDDADEGELGEVERDADERGGEVAQAWRECLRRRGHHRRGDGG